MDTLFSQINPQLTAQPDPDQTFRSYIDELLAAQKGFGGQFVNTPAQQQQQTPQTSITQGLFGKFLNDSGSGGDSYSQSGFSASPSPSSPTTSSWGMNQYGYNVGYDPAAGLKGALSMGPLGLLGGIQVSPDPLGKFAFEALLAQEARDAGRDNAYGIDPSVDPVGYVDAAMGGMGNVDSVTDASAGWGFGGDFGGYGGDTAGSGAPGSDSDSNGGGGYGGGTGGVGD